MYDLPHLLGQSPAPPPLIPSVALTARSCSRDRIWAHRARGDPIRPMQALLRAAGWGAAPLRLGRQSAGLAAWAGKRERPVYREPRPVGLLAHKVGMMNIWDALGVRHAITVLCVDRCHVLQVKGPHPDERRERWGVQVGAFPKRPYKTPKPQRFHCAKAGVEPKRVLSEFLVDAEHVLPVGTELRADVFRPGQFVDVTGTTIGKGTQGVMKRWGFAGGPASHGCSKAHRSAGSTGQSTKPGKTFKGKKMAGRMGNKKHTVQSLRVQRVDPDRNLIFVRGAVPGNAGRPVRVRSAVRKVRANNRDPAVMAAEVHDAPFADPRPPGFVHSAAPAGAPAQPTPSA